MWGEQQEEKEKIQGQKEPLYSGGGCNDTSVEDGAANQQLLIVAGIVNGVINIHISCLCILEEDTVAPFVRCWLTSSHR